MTALVVGLVLGLIVGAIAGALAARRSLDRRLSALFHTESGTRGLPARLREARALGVDQNRANQRAEAALRQLRETLDSIPHGIVLHGPHGDVTYANTVGENYIEGGQSNSLVRAAAANVDGHRLTLVAADEGVRPEPVRQLVELRGPPKAAFDIVLSPLAGGGHLALIEDVTERRHLEDVRRDFVANISHELRTPIGAMALLTETMAQTDDPETAARLSARIEAEAHRLANTIDDLMFLSSIEAGDQPVREPVRVEGVFREVVDRVAEAVGERGIEVKIVAPDDLVVSGDRRQLGSAVFNLVDNAAKYSEDGSLVVLSATVEPDAVLIEVEDHGVGIPRADLERIFERFYRVDRGRSRATGGTGLGLAIVRHVAENHAGTAIVRSREGIGTTFTIRLPRDPSVTPHAG